MMMSKSYKIKKKYKGPHNEGVVPTSPQFKICVNKVPTKCVRICPHNVNVDFSKFFWSV